jgi:broad specificity phosphatase PhoE
VLAKSLVYLKILNMSLEIYIARHGQNEDNVNGILNGHRDLPLTELGRQQAYDLAHGIEAIELTFDGVYTSPLDRAYETARIVCGSLGLKAKPVVIPELIERDFGSGTGRPIKEVVEEAGSDVIKTDGVTYVLDFGGGGEIFPQLLE